jgi:hypothetical protein
MFATVVAFFAIADSRTGRLKNEALAIWVAAVLSGLLSSSQLVRLGGSRALKLLGGLFLIGNLFSLFLLIGAL